MINVSEVSNLCRNGNSADGIQVYDYAKTTPNNRIVWGKKTSQIKKTLGMSVSVVNSDTKGDWTRLGNINIDRLFIDVTNGDD